jgi:hypothetical protein
MKLKFAIILCVISLANGNNQAFAETVYYYTPKPIGNIMGRVVYNQVTPTHAMGFNLSSQNIQVLTPMTGYNLGIFTGSNVPLPLDVYQIGMNNYGSTAESMYDTGSEPIFGVMLNSWDFCYDPRAPLAGTYLQYIFSDTDDYRPFSYGSKSVLYYSQMLQIPQAYAVDHGQAQITQGITFVDTVHQKYFWFHPMVFATNFSNVNHEKINYDGGTNAPMVETYFGPRTLYVTQSPSSYSSTNRTWSGWHWYGYSISYTQFKTVISAVNKMNQQFSTNPEDYRIGMFYVGAEVTRPTADYKKRNANLAYSSYGQWLYVQY